MLQSINGGGAWLGASNYAGGVNVNAYNSTTFSNTNSDAYFPIFPGQANTTGLTGFLYVDITNAIQINGQFTSNNGAIALSVPVGQGVASVNAFRFLYSSGNISGGDLFLYLVGPN